MRYRFPAPLWQVPNGSWYFVTLPFEVSDEIDDAAASARVGFGSVRVEARIGGSIWKTSIFPDSKAKAFVLPVKKAVRQAEGLADGTEVTVELSVVDG